MNMEDLRKSVRYAIDEVYGSGISVELKGDADSRARVLDLSSTGLSIEMNINSATAPAGIDDGGNFFVTLHVNETDILAEVQKVWSLITMSGDLRIYRAGLKFVLISDDDRLKLNSAIGQIREQLQSAARGHNRT